MKIGDIVTRKSYNKDIIFKIVGFGIDNKNEKIAILKGVAFRVIADAYLEDLEVVKVSDIKQILIDPTVENLIYKSVRSAQDREKKMNRAVPKLQANPNVYGIPGKVLQIDGDKEYLKICLDVYTELGIPAVGVAIPEENQYKEIINLLEKHNPDILVITGHDALTSRKGNITDLNNYRNALYLSLNNTLGGAFCIDGKLIPGANQKAGEFGHMILVPGGKKCYCGKQGCADAYCAASVLTDDTKETLEQFMKKVEEQDGQAVKVWKEYLNNLAILISNLRMAYDMDIILGGEVGGYLADHMITLGKKVMEYNGFEHDARYLKVCSYKREASAVGVAKHYLQAFIKTL